MYKKRETGLIEPEDESHFLYLLEKRKTKKLEKKLESFEDTLRRLEEKING